MIAPGKAYKVAYNVEFAHFRRRRRLLPNYCCGQKLGERFLRNVARRRFISSPSGRAGLKDVMNVSCIVGSTMKPPHFADISRTAATNSSISDRVRASVTQIRTTFANESRQCSSGKPPMILRSRRASFSLNTLTGERKANSLKTAPATAVPSQEFGTTAHRRSALSAGTVPRCVGNRLCRQDTCKRLLSAR